MTLKSLCLALVLALAGATVACGSPYDPDAADASGGGDGAPGADASTAPQTRPSSFVQTSGGGAAASSSYRLQLRIGAPQPAGTTTSAAFRAHLGPGATR